MVVIGQSSSLFLSAMGLKGLLEVPYSWWEICYRDRMLVKRNLRSTEDSTAHCNTLNPS